MKDNILSIVFIGFDGYEDLWDDCIFLFKKFWPDCPYDIYFVNNLIEKKWDNINVIHAGNDAEWSKKVQLAIKNIKSDYICLLLEDFFIGNTINTFEVKYIMDFMKRENIKYLKIQSNRPYKSHTPFYKNYHNFKTIKKSDHYGISLQPSIWEKEFLAEKLGTDNYNAWQFEFDRAKEAVDDSKEYYTNCLLDERNVFNINHGVFQGCWLPETVKYFEQRGIKLNIQRPYISPYRYIKRRLIGIANEIIPHSLHKFIKATLEKFSIKFISTIRNNK